MSRRFNLREFQQSLIERMQARDGAGEQIRTLGVQIGERNWLVDMGDLGGALPVPPLTRVPLAKPWFAGAISVRGILYGVTDLAAYRQEGKASGAPANRVLLVAERHAFNAALLVERVLGLRGTQGWTDDSTEGRSQLRDEQGDLWFRLDIPGLLAQPEFLQVGA
jgi:twitching motility protein PilI